MSFFLAHSWHDDVSISKLSSLGCFMLRRLYEPSFWLDKACIDQENIAAPVKRHVLTGAWEPQVMTEEHMNSMKAAAHGTAIHLGHIDAFCTNSSVVPSSATLALILHCFDSCVFRV